MGAHLQNLVGISIITLSAFLSRSSRSAITASCLAFCFAKLLAFSSSSPSCCVISWSLSSNDFFSLVSCEKMIKRKKVFQPTITTKSAKTRNFSQEICFHGRVPWSYSRALMKPWKLIHVCQFSMSSEKLNFDKETKNGKRQTLEFESSKSVKSSSCFLILASMVTFSSCNFWRAASSSSKLCSKNIILSVAKQT